MIVGGTVRGMADRGGETNGIREIPGICCGREIGWIGANLSERGRETFESTTETCRRRMLGTVTRGTLGMGVTGKEEMEVGMVDEMVEIGWTPVVPQPPVVVRSMVLVHPHPV